MAAELDSSVGGVAEMVSLLVCYGERKRPISIRSDSNLSDLRLEVAEAFGDVLPSSSRSTTQDIASTLVLQIKSEEWEGTFVDLKEGDPLPANKSVLKIVSGSMAEKASDALQLVSSLSKHSEKEKSVLAKLFGSSSSVVRKRPTTFDPMAEASNFESQKKKKCVVRPVTRDVIFLAEKSSRLPQKSLKSSMIEGGRVKSVVFKRTMTPLQVQRALHEGFKLVAHDGAFHFLMTTKDNKLIDPPTLQPSGDDICAKRGAVYVYQEQKRLPKNVVEDSDEEFPPVFVNMEVWNSKEDERSVLEKAESQRTQFISSLSLVEGSAHQVERADVYSSVMTLFVTSHDAILQEYPLIFRFKGEKAIDVGGVSRDLFTSFFDAIYCKFFDGVSLLYPALNPHMTTYDLNTLGLILSCGYLLVGVIPIRIAFPTLAAMLLPAAKTFPDHIMVDSFAGSISAHDAAVVEIARKKVDSKEAFSESLQSDLLTALSGFDCRKAPSMDTFVRMVCDISNYVFLRKPYAFISDVRAGIPQAHRGFWKGLSCRAFYDIYMSMQATPAKILSMLCDVTTSTPKEEAVLSYLRQYIGNMRREELQVFLRFVTGASVCTSNRLSVTFNSVEGLARRPVAHTCAYSIELSTSYSSYSEFAQEFSAILNTKQTQLWSMDCV